MSFKTICKQASDEWLLCQLMHDASRGLTNGDEGLPLDVRREAAQNTRTVVSEVARRMGVDMDNYRDRFTPLPHTTDEQTINQ